MTYETIEDICKSYNPQKDSKSKEQQEGYTVSELQSIHLTGSNVIKTILHVYSVVKEHFEEYYQEEVLKHDKLLQLEIESYKKKREQLTIEISENSRVKDLELQLKDLKSQLKDLKFEYKHQEKLLEEYKKKRKWF